MTKRPYTGLAGRTGRKCLFLSLLLLAGILSLRAQLHQGCPHVHAPAYENPLYDKWLSAYDVGSYEMDLRVSNISTEIGGSALIYLRAKRKLDTLVLELNSMLTVGEVVFQEGWKSPTGGELLPVTHEDDVLYLALPYSLEADELFRVRISYEGDGGSQGGFFSGLSNRTDYSYDQQVSYTLSEPMNARDWFPVKQVLDDKIDSVTFRLTCDSRLLAASNGLLTAVEEQGREHTLTWESRYPMAYYLLSFAVASYREYSFMAPLSGEGDSVLVQNFIYDDEKVLQDWEEEIRATAGMIEAFSRLLVDYPFKEEKYGHAMAPMGGGMEHQTMTTIQSFGFSLVAHELAHQWFGDYVTCGNWQDIWINEGFASYFEYIAAQELLGQEEADQWMNNAMTVAMRETQASVYVPAEEVEDTYRLFSNSLSYKKGAVLLHMIRFILDDDELFFHTLKVYLERFGNGGATGEDFREVLEEVSGMDFSCFFEQWYYGQGYPRYMLYWEQVGDSLRIRCEQQSTTPEVTPRFDLPLELELLYLDGTSERTRLLPESSGMDQWLPAQGWIRSLRFDPDRHLLATSTVVEELSGDRVFRMGPNPSKGVFHVQFPGNISSTRVRITNYAGQVLLSEEYYENPIALDLNGYAQGAYILELSNEQGTFKERIVKIAGGE